MFAQLMAQPLMPIALTLGVFAVAAIVSSWSKAFRCTYGLLSRGRSTAFSECSSDQEAGAPPILEDDSRVVCR